MRDERIMTLIIDVTSLIDTKTRKSQRVRIDPREQDGTRKTNRQDLFEAMITVMRDMPTDIMNIIVEKRGDERDPLK